MRAFDVIHNALDPSLRTAVEQTSAILAALERANFQIVRVHCGNNDAP